MNLDAEPDGSYAHVWDVPDPPANGEVEGRVRVLARDRFGWLGLRYSSWFTIVDAVSPVPDIRLVDRLGSAHPNPFNPRTTLAYSLAAAADIRLAVYDVAGRRIATLDQGPRPVGEHTAVWLGRTEDGSSAPSGVYFARLEIHGDHGTRILTTRLALVK